MKHSLIPQYRQLHAQAHFGGRTIYGHADRIAKLVVQSRAKTLLDYGSGKGRQYVEGRIHELWGGIMPRLYDPAVEGIDKPPRRTFHGVICTDVLEHIPEDELDETLYEIKGYAKHWVFFSVCCEPAKKLLPDGRNVHVTVRSREWWIERLGQVFTGNPEIHLAFDRSSKSKPKSAVKRKELWKPLGWRK